MAYRCKNNYSKECDGCGECMPEIVSEARINVAVMIKLEFGVYNGEIAELVRKGRIAEAKELAEAIVENQIDSCGEAGENMTVESVEIEVEE